MKISYMQFLDDQLFVINEDLDDLEDKAKKAVTHFDGNLEKLDPKTIEYLASVMQRARQRKHAGYEDIRPHPNDQQHAEALKKYIEDKGLKGIRGIVRLARQIKERHRGVGGERDKEELGQLLGATQQSGAPH
jgi:hypothetical protein